MTRTYEDAISALHTLQSNTSALKEICRSGQIRTSDRFEKTKAFAARAKVPVEKLDQLNAIHVSGTKGKGSVCAFCDSILHRHGLKTGFYSSPHLVEVRERIRINQKVISKELFAAYFWECWDNLKLDNNSGEMPQYFVFLTILSFFIFLQEKVDVAIVEVGIGGAFDTTNILKCPWVCGVTSLGHDHLAILGGTTQSIAWNKAGIFKCNVPAFTVSQDEISMRVLAQRAKELKTLLKVVPDMNSYSGENISTLGIEGRHQFQNASLAVQLCNTWLQRRASAEQKCIKTGEKEKTLKEADDIIPLAETFPINLVYRTALEQTYWPGRSHCIKRRTYTLYLDGAHTPKSINACTIWFCNRADEEKEELSPKNVVRVLIFNCTGERDPRKLLAPLLSCNFDYAVFCTNSVAEETVKKTSGISELTSSLSLKLKHCHGNHEAWKLLTGQTVSCVPLHDLDKRLRANTMQSSCVVSSVTDALHCVLADREPVMNTSEHSRLPRVLMHASHLQVMVTGSLHLVGAAMKVLGPSIVQV